MVEENYQACDSPSGSSTSEPYEGSVNSQTLSFIDQSFFNKLNQLTSDNDKVFMQQNSSSTASSTPPSNPSFTDPLLPNSNSVQESSPYFWPNYNNAIPELTSHIEQSRTKETTIATGMQIRVLGVPQTGAKSRVETQIKLCIQLVTEKGDKAQHWSHLKLPEYTIAKDKLKRLSMIPSFNSSKMAGIETTVPPSQNILHLSSRVICASDPDRKVVVCSGCIQRERKRSQRRKEKKKIDHEINSLLTAEEQRVLLFNCSELVDFNSGNVILPTRITCYCRHHNERLGFCIYFEMHDHLGQKIASGMSPPIMITDDHKSNKLKASRKRPRKESEFKRVTSFDSILINQPSSHYQIQPRPSESLTKEVFLPPEIPAIEQPILKRLIPNEGPTYGGIEVTLLGSGFRSDLTCMFGNTAASNTQYWSPNTLVCTLPPAADAGTVIVSFKEYPLVMDSREMLLFTYYNENDRALMELALQVVGLKMTGKVEDAREIAIRIVQGGGNSQASPYSKNIEQNIVQALQVMTTFRDVSTKDVSIANTQGHTMLHLAVMLGWTRLTSELLELGCDINLLDKNGYTALHYASWYRHTEIILMLLENKADTEISNCWNKKPIHMTEDSTIRNIFDSYSKGSFENDEDDENLCLSEISWEQDNPLIQYLDQVENTYHLPEEIMDAEPLYPIEPLTDDEDFTPKEMTWMQRTLSHFQPNTSNDTLQNIKNTNPATDLKSIADHIIQLPRKPLSGLFSNNKEQETPDQDLAWYIALAYSMGARSLVSEDEKEDTKQECIVIDKRRDRTLYSFWVPMLCIMIIWLIFQFISSNPNVTDTIVNISGFQRQYHIIQ